MVRFISYDGAYPNLCRGTLKLEIDGKEVVLNDCLKTGGEVRFGADYEPNIEKGPWSIKLPEEYQVYIDEIERIVNENIPRGCCGGCV